MKIHHTPEPFIFSLATEICEGDDITLSVNDASGGDFSWSANAGSSNLQSVTVAPSVPGETYYVTITNPEGCIAVTSATIGVSPLPIVSIAGSDSICDGGTTLLSPTTGGIWTSSNYSIALVSNSGVVSGISPGTATFTFRR